MSNEEQLSIESPGSELVNKLNRVSSEVLKSTSSSKFDRGSDYPIVAWFADALSLPDDEVAVKWVTGKRINHATGEAKGAKFAAFLLDGSLSDRFSLRNASSIGPGAKFLCAILLERHDQRWKPVSAVGDSESPLGLGISKMFPGIPFQLGKPGDSEMDSGMMLTGNGRPLNTILYGPPGTGKTFATVGRALGICGVQATNHATALKEYRRLSDLGRIHFVTFHQSFSYEDFVEGIRPLLDEESDSLTYVVKDGIFKEACDIAQAKSSGSGIPVDIAGRNFWKMSLGNIQEDEADVYLGCLDEGVAKLGWGSEVDFSDCDTEAEVTRRFRSELGDRTQSDYGPVAVHRFKNEMKVDDVIVVPDGNEKFRAFGIVTGDYDHRPEKWGQRRSVEWIRTFDKSLPVRQILSKNFMQKTLYALRPEILKLEALEELLQGDATEAGGADPCVIIIDEINRANVSKVFGELITLLESNKRIGGDDERTVILPYSRSAFGIPPNLFVVGTMNTADRSIASLDIALRRRFEFVECPPDPALLKDDPGTISGVDVAELLEVINERIEFLLDRDHAIGHSYFMGATSIDDLADVIRNRVIPLLQEYFFGDLSKVALILGSAHDVEGGVENENPTLMSRQLNAASVFGDASDLDDRVITHVNQDFLDATEEDLVPYLKGIVS